MNCIVPPPSSPPTREECSTRPISFWELTAKDMSKVCDEEMLRQIHGDAVRLNMPHKALVAVLRLAFITPHGNQRNRHLIEVARLHDVLSEAEKDPVRSYNHLCAGIKAIAGVKSPPKGLEGKFHVVRGRFYGKMSFYVLDPQSSEYAKQAISDFQMAVRCISPKSDIDEYIEAVAIRVDFLNMIGKPDLAKAALDNVLKNVMFRVIHDERLVGRTENARRIHEGFLWLAKKFEEDPKRFYPDGWQPLPPPLPPRRKR